MRAKPHNIPVHRCVWWVQLWRANLVFAESLIHFWQFLQNIWSGSTRCALRSAFSNDSRSASVRRMACGDAGSEPFIIFWSLQTEADTSCQSDFLSPAWDSMMYLINQTTHSGLTWSCCPLHLFRCVSHGFIVYVLTFPRLIHLPQGSHSALWGSISPQVGSSLKNAIRCASFRRLGEVPFAEDSAIDTASESTGDLSKS